MKEVSSVVCRAPPVEVSRRHRHKHRCDNHTSHVRQPPGTLTMVHRYSTKTTPPTLTAAVATTPCNTVPTTAVMNLPGGQFMLISISRMIISTWMMTVSIYHIPYRYLISRIDIPYTVSISHIDIGSCLVTLLAPRGPHPANCPQPPPPHTPHTNRERKRSLAGEHLQDVIDSSKNSPHPWQFEGGFSLHKCFISIMLETELWRHLRLMAQRPTGNTSRPDRHFFSTWKVY